MSSSIQVCGQHPSAQWLVENCPRFSSGCLVDLPRTRDAFSFVCVFDMAGAREAVRLKLVFVALARV